MSYLPDSTLRACDGPCSGRLPDLARSQSLREVEGVLERRCSTCREWLPLSAFHVARNNKLGRQARCKPCGVKAARLHLANNAEARARHNARERKRRREQRRQALLRDPSSGGYFGSRGLKGELNPRAKLSDNARDELVRRAVAGERKIDLAAEYGVSASTVRKLAAGKQQKPILPRGEVYDLRPWDDGASPAKITEGRAGGDVR